MEVLLLRSNTHCGANSCSYLLSGLKRLDFVFGCETFAFAFSAKEIHACRWLPHDSKCLAISKHDLYCSFLP